MVKMLRILYDGWDLVHLPNSPAALHLHTLLRNCPADVQAVVGLPGVPAHHLPAGIEVQQLSTANTSLNRLRWMQRDLPNLAGTCQINFLHTFEYAPLFSSQSCLLSPSWQTAPPRMGDGSRIHRTLVERLSSSLGQGGLARARAVFWPRDLEKISPPNLEHIPRLLLEPDVFPELIAQPATGNHDNQHRLELPETYILCTSPGETGALRRLLAAWSWAARPIGDHYPLLVVGLSSADRPHFEALCHEYRVGTSARSLPPLPLAELVGLYRSCHAVFEPYSPPAWGNSLRLALASGKPVVGLENDLSDAILGPAGYLVEGQANPADQDRLLGAALISVVVEQRLTDDLSAASLRRGRHYSQARFAQSLGEAYHSLAA